MSDEIKILKSAPTKALIYQSAAIFERRDRILREARRMISQVGYENFSIRELARRAEVAPRTLYNAFGARENIIIGAIYQYSESYMDRIEYPGPIETLAGQLERSISVHARNLQIRPYVIAVMSIYNSQGSNPLIRNAISELSDQKVRPFSERVEAAHGFAEDCTSERYLEYASQFVYATLSAWCVGDVADEDLVARILEATLMLTVTSTRGAVMKEASTWLKHLRARSSEWTDLVARSVALRPQR